jgi:hypothetical protein
MLEKLIAEAEMEKMRYKNYLNGQQDFEEEHK